MAVSSAFAVVIVPHFLSVALLEQQFAGELKDHCGHQCNSKWLPTARCPQDPRPRPERLGWRRVAVVWLVLAWQRLSLCSLASGLPKAPLLAAEPIAWSHVRFDRGNGWWRSSRSPLVSSTSESGNSRSSIHRNFPTAGLIREQKILGFPSVKKRARAHLGVPTERVRKGLRPLNPKRRRRLRKSKAEA